jgi:phenylacetate-CoA ligase
MPGLSSVLVTPSAGWNWPWGVPPEAAQIAIDAHMALLLERSPPAFWQEFQNRRLRMLVAHVQHVSPWWREWLQVSPEDVSLATLARLPVLRRQDFRAAVESAGALPLPAEHGPTTSNSTSGSSGVPAAFHVSALTARIIAGQYYADHARQGLDMRQPLATMLSGIPPHPGMEHRYQPPNPGRGTGPAFFRHNLGYSMHEHARWLAKVDPAFLNAPAALISGLLDAYEEGIAPPRRLRLILQIGETVTPQLREQARRVLDARICDRYTCTEIGPIAFQCPHDDGRYHVCVSNAIVEIVDEAGNACAEGEAGAVLVTGLHHWASPVIRYDLGDIATMHPTCTCGERVPSLSAVLGRKRFLVRLPSGERLYLNVQAKHFLDVAPVREHRLTQYTERDIRVELVLERALTAQEREGMVAMLRERLHPSFMYHVEQVDAIAWTSSRKRQDLVCLI